MDKSKEAVVATVSTLNETKELQQKFEERAKAKHDALLKLQNIDQQTKDKIREGMTFRLVDAKGKKKERSFDKRGQEHAIDTVGSVKKGHGFSAEDNPKVYRAMEEIVKLVKQALAAEAGGKKIYDPTPQPNETVEKAMKRINDEIERDIFTPLVREGLLPETFVLSQYSEVAKLLKGAMGSYKDSLQQEEQSKIKSDAKMDANLHGASTGLDRLKAVGGKGSQTVDRVKRAMISEKNERRLNIGIETGKLVQKGSSAVTSIQGWTNGKALENADKFLNPEDHRDALSTERQGSFDSTSDSDRMRSLLNQEKREQRYIKYLKKIPFFVDNPEAAGKAIEKFQEQTEIKEINFTKMSASLLKELVSSGIDVGTKAYDIHELNKDIDKATVELRIQESGAKAVEQLDAALVAEIEKIDASAAIAFEGLYPTHTLSALDSAAGKDKDAGVHLVTALANGYVATFSAAAPPNGKKEFEKVGQTISKAIVGKGLGGNLDKALVTDTNTAFKPVVEEIKKIVSKSVSGPIATFLSDQENVKQMIGASLELDSEEAMDELFRSEEEIKEYERMLVLIDEGGMSVAEQRSIENLILQIEKERKVLELVAKLGGSLTGLASSSVKIAASASEQLTSVVAGEVVGALKAAKIILQLAVNVKKAADRAALLAKFKTDLKRSKIAVSSLTSTIQGFYNNKVEQVTFRTIEDALMAVELAATIIGTVPTPYTVAIGKTLGAVNAAAQQAAKVSEMIYNEVMLSKAWATTKAAIDSPGDRALGLAALRLNPTLGMHALAWAGMEKQPPDPIARMTLDSVGLNEQTLAVSGTEAKVRQYLETLLNEDRKLLDPSEIKTKWLPTDISLSVKDWFVICKRAERDAHPPLAKDDGAKVVEVLKAVDQHQLDDWEESAKTGGIEIQLMQEYVDEISELIEVLKKYTPQTKDGEVHDEMNGVVAQFLAMASSHRDRLSKIADTNTNNRNEERVKVVLADHIDLLKQVLDSEEVQKQVRLKNFMELCQEAHNDVDSFATLSLASNIEINEKLGALKKLLGTADQMITTASLTKMEFLAA